MHLINDRFMWPMKFIQALQEKVIFFRQHGLIVPVGVKCEL